MVAFVGDEDLSLPLQAAEGVGVDDAVAVTLEVRTRGAAAPPGGDGPAIGSGRLQRPPGAGR